MQEAAMKTRWQEKRETSLEALIVSAMRCFHERGYAATRVEDIVAGTGYTSGAFYFHFTNKSDCFWQVIDHRERLRGNWTHVTDGLDPATASLADILGHVFDRFESAAGGLENWFLIMVDFRQQHRADAEAQEHLNATYRRWVAEIADFVASLKDGGWIGVDRDTKLLAAQLFAATEGLQSHAALYQLDPAHTQQALIDMLSRILQDQT
jgi:TetR/AcrR family transcriptional repressor of nem operon